MTRLQPIYDIAELCAQKGVSQAILCPGSRCAPLTLAFAQHPSVTSRTISDERSAAFVALGMAQQMQQPTVLVCTSGSAAYNFAPAIAEAFFQEVPLLIFTADRPKEWIDQWDGQTIRQTNIYGSHVKKSIQLPEDYDHVDAQWYINRAVNEAINLSIEFPCGPVHINVPLREPLYPAKGEKIQFSQVVRITSENKYTASLTQLENEELAQSLGGFSKVMVVAGQQEYNDALIKLVERFSKKHSAVVIGDVISNFHGSGNTIRFADSILSQGTKSVKESLQPELLITFGKSVISKNSKQFIRSHKPLQHWHIQAAGTVPDTFQSLTRVIRCTADTFFESLLATEPIGEFQNQKKSNYFHLWQAEEHRTHRSHEDFFHQASLAELSVIKELLQSLPMRCNLHLSNSMAVRYANMIGLTTKQKGVHVYANRGTSGIDGCTSTAVGNALTSDVPTILITGDMAFFYDRNAFWHNYKMPNLHIVVVNNQGGIIFGMIDGSAELPESEEYFVTQQKLSAKNLAEEFGIDYILLDSPKKIKNSLKYFFNFEGTTKILELISNQKTAKEAFNKFNLTIKKEYDS
ncbi:MAG: 2-succinyl-5-enolpyruvyl-6-hydroxy-3-cyclohexene-1-carboxylic-acid synthase [Cyclobacteriaceae bacterium]|nr:2-succinyl-5-enolpyruvyl-6-hydroxy-3-cyclohexene-1-carboxylic-acid synthase [Cyclobacteriaceae bacterium]